MKPLTFRQCEVLSAFAGLYETHGYPPTVRDVADALGLSNHGVECHLRLIEKKGCLRRDPVRSRGRTITPEGWFAIGRRQPSERITGTVDVGSRCRRCEAMLFGGLHLCLQHRSAAA